MEDKQQNVIESHLLYTKAILVIACQQNLYALVKEGQHLLQSYALL